MTAAIEDRRITRNPRQLRGADKEHSEERPVLSVAQVLALAERMPYRKYRALILITAFCSLSWGEVTALRWRDVAADGSWVRVSSQFIDLVGRGLVRTPPKSRAGARTVTVPTAIRPDVIGTCGTSSRRRLTHWCSPSSVVDPCVAATSVRW